MKRGVNLPEGLMLLVGVSIVVLIVTIAMPMMAIKASSKENEETKMKDSIVVKDETIKLDGAETVKVFITSENRIEEVNLEEYITSVVSSEMPASFELEALKAQAIAARTFLASRKVKNCEKATEGEICDTIHCQVYMSRESRIAKWTEGDGEANWEKIKAAVDATKGKVLSYDGELVMYPQFFSTSSGKTEKAVDVFSGDIPYLVATESTGEEIAPKFKSERAINIDEFINTINSKYSEAKLTSENIESSLEIISRSDSGGVKEIKIGGVKVKGTEFRMLLNLNSTNFEFNITENEINFNCKGYGHGVGMSQWGANVMAKEGEKYDSILKHYYTGVEIVNLEFKDK